MAEITSTIYNGKELQEELGQYDYGARQYDPVIARWNSVDPLASAFPHISSYAGFNNNPLRFTDPTGMAPFDFVRDKEGGIYWDKNANDQASTKKGETYLGKDLTFTFDSYISNSFDGPNPPWGAEGLKLRSTTNVTSNEDAGGNLLSVDVKSTYDIKSTGGLSMFKGRDYFSGLGKDQNMGINISNTNGFNATFEQHASVPGLEALGLNMLGYDVVNVAQKLTLGLSGNRLSVSASTDVFPSASLSVNGTSLFKYNQPSFVGTHGRNISYSDNGTGGVSTTATPRRPAPNFYTRYKQ